MLVHICCSVDSHYFLKELAKITDEKLIGFFYNPNIHPYSEYRLRALDVKRSCRELNIELIEGDYNLDSWLERVKGFESEPERGKRCNICFDERLEKSFEIAKELGEKRVTTTLLTSPKKSIDKLRASGEKIAKKYDLEFSCFDFRIDGGTQRQFLLAKKDRLYKQNYCGCIYALKNQRDSQKIFTTELISQLNNQTQLNSIESREELFKKVHDLIEQKRDFEFTKSRFLNYRLLNALVKINKEVIPSYFLAYSTNRKKYIKTKIDFEIENLFYFKQDEVKAIDLESFNNLTDNSFKSVKELLKNPLSIEQEIELREKIVKNRFDISTIFILDEVVDAKYEIHIDSITFEDVKTDILEHKK